MFQLALPHPSAIRSWYNTIDAEPGSSEKCFNTLKLKNEEYKKQNKCLICALVMDEIGIKKGFQRSGDGKCVDMLTLVLVLKVQVTCPRQKTLW